MPCFNVPPFYISDPSNQKFSIVERKKKKERKRTWNDLAIGPFTPSGLMYVRKGFTPD